MSCLIEQVAVFVEEHSDSDEVNVLEDPDRACASARQLSSFRLIADPPVEVTRNHRVLVGFVMEIRWHTRCFTSRFMPQIKKSDKHAFTLVEIMIVVAIIA